MSATARPASFTPDLTVQPSANALWFVVDGLKLLLNAENGLPKFGDVELDLIQPLGWLSGRPAFAARLRGDAPDGCKLLPIRATYGLIPDEWFGLAGFAAQAVEFDRTHRFCGACATPLQRNEHERAKSCPRCGLTVYPRVAPVVMVLIERGQGAGKELLLARGPHFAPGVYSALAGFVEPSETLEDACHREVLEEVGLRVQNLRYAFSQPWPFPHSLMIAFNAEYDSGEIVPQPGEIEDAQWFNIRQLPTLPTVFSTARRMLDDAVASAIP